MVHAKRHWVHRSLVALIGFSLSLPALQLAHAQQPMKEMMPVERSKVLSEPGVYAVFSLLELRPEWNMLDAAARKKAAAEVAAVIEKHKATVVVDAYLTRGLSESADFLLRSHAYDLASVQGLVNDVLATGLGRRAELANSFVGVTKALNYASKKPELLKQLQATTYQGDAPRYAIVIPTKKNATWWNLPAEKRLDEMVTHTLPTLAFLASVKRKLYHASGLDDLDFITYFETNDLTAFNNLVISLLSVPENLHNDQLGRPTVVGTIHSVDEVMSALAR